jgi:hypothetical protein
LIVLPAPVFGPTRVFSIASRATTRLHTTACFGVTKIPSRATVESNLRAEEFRSEKNFNRHESKDDSTVAAQSAARLPRLFFRKEKRSPETAKPARSGPCNPVKPGNIDLSQERNSPKPSPKSSGKMHFR